MKFKKEIVSSGVYLVQGADGVRRYEVITDDRLGHWADKQTEMVNSGMQIPAPWQHDLKSLPENTAKISASGQGISESSKDNAGYWDRLWVENHTLMGEFDCPNEEDAKKVGATVRETSVYACPRYVDGSGTVWEDALMHIALVTHAVENNQSNFEKVPDGTLALAMSQRVLSMSNSIDGFGSFTEVLKKLEEIAKIVLPTDTTFDNFVDRLNAALSQKAASEQDDNNVGTVTKPPRNAVSQPGRVIFTMSTFTEDQVDALVKANAVNTATKQPFTSEDLVEKVDSEKDPGTLMGVGDSEKIPEEISNHPVVQKLAGSVAILMNIAKTAKQDRYQDRINILIKTGAVTEEYAKTYLEPLLSSIKMSLDVTTGKQIEEVDAIDGVLTALENVPSTPSFTQSSIQMSSDGSKGYVSHQPPMGDKSKLSPEDVDKAVKILCENTGITA